MKQMLRMAAVCIGLLLVIALPVSAAEYGAPEITPKTTMKQLRENPSIKVPGCIRMSISGSVTATCCGTARTTTPWNR